MKKTLKLLILCAVVVSSVWLIQPHAQVPPRSVGQGAAGPEAWPVSQGTETVGGTASGLTDTVVRLGCIRDDATTTLDASHADSDWTAVRCNARGEVWTADGTALADTIDSVGAVPRASAVTTNGTNTCYHPATASTNAINCKASAGNVYMIRAINTTATAYYLRMYNSSGTPTCSSATGFVETIPVLATGGQVSPIAVGQSYATGIGFCITGGAASTDNTNAAVGVFVTVLYK
jgi:hypothetical protein